MTIGLVFTATILLALISVYPVNRSHELRPQAVQVFEEKIGEINPAPVEVIEHETSSNETADVQAVPVVDAQPAVAGTSNDNPDTDVKQTIEKEITGDAVKVKVEQKVNSNQSINNKVNIKVDTKQDPPLVEISTAPNPTNCSSNSYDCSDFLTCLAAENVYHTCSSDIHQLDPDNDGVPCDNLCQ